MNTQEIWNLIEESKNKTKNQVNYIMNTLSKMSAKDIIDFSIHFETCYRETYNSKLWGAAYIIFGGCSDDRFDYFRGWLIAQGKDLYEEALLNPDRLADYIPTNYAKDELTTELKGMIKASSNAYILKETSSLEYNDEYYNKYLDLMKDAKFNFIYPIIQFDWDNEKDLAPMFPKLWAKFGKNNF